MLRVQVIFLFFINYTNEAVVASRFLGTQCAIYLADFETDLVAGVIDAQN
ncbi:MAG: hypothetical protein ACRD3E_04120 [Terriglobales bacterium]